MFSSSLAHRLGVGNCVDGAPFIMKALIITEKSSQAKDLRAALGGR